MATINTTVAEQRLFVKVGVTADTDWADPANAEPAEGRQHLAVWNVVPSSSSPGLPIRSPSLLIKVTFRDGDDVEIAGTFSMDVLVKSAASLSASEDDEIRNAWGRIGRDTSMSSADFHRLDIGGDMTFALRLYDIAATGATHVYVTARQWGET